MEREKPPGNHERGDQPEEPEETPGPDPERVPGLEPGGSVPAGETPPEAASASRAVSHPQPATARPATWVWITVTGVVVLLLAGFFRRHGDRAAALRLVTPARAVSSPGPTRPAPRRGPLPLPPAGEHRSTPDSLRRAPFEDHPQAGPPGGG